MADTALTPTPVKGEWTTTARRVMTATPNGVSIIGQACTLGLGVIHNTSAALFYLRLYNLSTGLSNGVSIPVITIPVPANTSVNLAPFFGENGMRFTSGVSIAAAPTASHTDAAGIAAGSILELIYT